MDRIPISCRKCGDPFVITHTSIEHGFAFVKPGQWFVPRPARHAWCAVCGCDELTAFTEGDLYRLMGQPYA